MYCTSYLVDPGSNPVCLVTFSGCCTSEVARKNPTSATSCPRSGSWSTRATIPTTSSRSQGRPSTSPEEDGESFLQGKLSILIRGSYRYPGHQTRCWTVLMSLVILELALETILICVEVAYCSSEIESLEPTYFSSRIGRVWQLDAMAYLQVEQRFTIYSI